MNDRLNLYKKVFITMSGKFSCLGEILSKKEQEIKNIKKGFFNKLNSLNIEKNYSSILKNIQFNLNELKIDLQISALNGKIKSLDMKEFSEIISVIGLSLLEEASKIAIRFNNMETIFNEIGCSVKRLIDDFNVIKKVEYNFSERIFAIDDFIQNEILFREEANTFISEDIFQRIVSSLNERIENISYFKSSKFQINFRHFKKDIRVSLKKLRLLLQDFNNFVFKINYLTLITRIEVGKLKDDEFIMVVNNLTLATSETQKINKQIIKIFNHYQKLYNELIKLYSELAIKLRTLIYREYIEILSEVEEELEGFLKFLNNKEEILRGVKC